MGGSKYWDLDVIIMNISCNTVKFYSSTRFSQQLRDNLGVKRGKFYSLSNFCLEINQKQKSELSCDILQNIKSEVIAESNNSDSITNNA